MLLLEEAEILKEKLFSVSSFPWSNRLKKRNQQIITGHGAYVITPSDFSIHGNTTWVLDIESLIHIYKLLQELQISKKIGNSKRFLNVGAGSHVLILTLKIIKQVFISNNVIVVHFDECNFHRPSSQKWIYIVNIEWFLWYHYEWCQNHSA